MCVKEIVFDGHDSSQMLWLLKEPFWRCKVLLHRYCLDIWSMEAAAVRQLMLVHSLRTTSSQGTTVLMTSSFSPLAIVEQ